jgi:hypothetical protein
MIACMHLVDLVDETYLAVPPQSLAEVVADPARWQQWWPDRRLEVFMDRGVKGQRWAIAGDLLGSAEIWLEEYRDGTILHYYLRADPPEGVSLQPRAADRLRRREAVGWKRRVWALKAELESGRHPGGAGLA